MKRLIETGKKRLPIGGTGGAASGLVRSTRTLASGLGIASALTPLGDLGLAHGSRALHSFDLPWPSLTYSGSFATGTVVKPVLRRGETQAVIRADPPVIIDETPEDAFMREHDLTAAVAETERLAREQFGSAFRRTERTVRVDGDFGTEYLYVSVLIDTTVDALLNAEPAFLAALAANVQNVDWSTILVSLRIAPNTN